MKRITKILGSVAILVVITLLGLAYFATRHSAPTANNSSADARLAASSSPASKQPSPLKITQQKTSDGSTQTEVKSNSGYTASFPSDWKTEDTSNKTYTGVQIGVGENEPTAFRVRISESPIADSTFQPRAIDSGTITTLQNGLLIWEQNKETSTRGSGSDTEYCPTLHLVSMQGDHYHFSQKLSNGKYLTIQAGYCLGENSSPTLDYEQQLSSSPWASAIKSIGDMQIQ